MEGKSEYLYPNVVMQSEIVNLEKKEFILHLCTEVRFEKDKKWHSSVLRYQIEFEGNKHGGVDTMLIMNSMRTLHGDVLRIRNSSTAKFASLDEDQTSEEVRLKEYYKIK
jgi:hypothetical protein